MERNELPFGTQFTPNVVDLRIILQLIKDNEGAAGCPNSRRN